MKSNDNSREINQFANVTLRRRHHRRDFDRNCDPNTGIMANTLDTIAEQLSRMNTRFDDVEKAVNFTSDKYDEILRKLDEISSQNLVLKEDINKNKEKISELEWKINQLEQKLVYGHLVVSGVPESKNEDTNSITDQLLTIAGLTKGKSTTIKSFRMGAPQPGRIRPIKLITNDPELANNLIEYSRKKQPNANSLSKHFQHKQRIFISEYMTNLTTTLFKLTREKAKQLDWKFCWIKNGIIHTRRDENTARMITVYSPKDLEKMKN